MAATGIDARLAIIVEQPCGKISRTVNHAPDFEKGLWLFVRRARNAAKADRLGLKRNRATASSRSGHFPVNTRLRIGSICAADSAWLPRPACTSELCERYRAALLATIPSPTYLPSTARCCVPRPCGKTNGAIVKRDRLFHITRHAAAAPRTFRQCRWRQSAQTPFGRVVLHYFFKYCVSGVEVRVCARARDE